MKKINTISRISMAVFALEASKGHMKWKVTELEKKSKISRSMIYRYLGDSKKEILKSALAVFTAQFYGFDEGGLDIPFSQRIQEARETVIKYPEVSVFYVKWRGQNNWINDELVNTEKKFQKKLKNLYPQIEDKKIWMAHAFLHGLVTAPFLTSEQAGSAASEVEKLFS